MTEFLDVPGGRIAYDVTGSGPLVVLPPGIGVRRQAYRFLAPVLAQAGYRVATADLRGHGESSMGWAAIHRHRRRRRPARPGRSPGRARGHRRVLALRRRGDHRRGDAAGAGRRDRRDQPVHQETEVRPGRAAADPPLPPVRLPADRHAGVPQPGPVAALPQPGRPHPPADYADYIAALAAKLREPGRMAEFQKTFKSTPAGAEAQLPHVRCPALVIMGTLDPDFAHPGRRRRDRGGHAGRGGHGRDGRRRRALPARAIPRGGGRTGDPVPQGTRRCLERGGRAPTSRGPPPACPAKSATPLPRPACPPGARRPRPVPGQAPAGRA